MCVSVMAVAVAALVTSAVGVGLQAYSAREQAKASNQAAEYNAQVQDRNATIAETQAVRAEDVGKVEAKQHRLRVSQLKAKQRVAAAGSGVVVDEGSPLEILKDTAELGELDALTIKQNAAQDAWGYRTQAAGYTAQAGISRASRVSPNLGAATTAVSGIGSLGSQYVGFKTSGAI